MNPDLIVALGLIKEGNNWIRPEEDFAIVAREVIDLAGHHQLIEIKREYLIDYLAARNLLLRLSYYRQRVENVAKLEGGPYEGLQTLKEERDGGRFEILVRALEDIHGGSWASIRVWRTDIDDEEDAPVLGPESDENTASESAEGHRYGYPGIRVEGEYWREEWIEHQGRSVRVRGDAEPALPQFIVSTDGARLPSTELNDEDIGRWLWFRPGVVNELLTRRGFSLDWYTAETGGISSTSGYVAHFGINSSDLVVLYAHDVARLAPWEQHVWAAYNVGPDGKVPKELLDSQMRTKPASTEAVEVLFLKAIYMLEAVFEHRFGVSLFNQKIDDSDAQQRISRFASTDRPTLLRLAKEIVRVFSDRLNVGELRKLSSSVGKEKLGSNKLLQDVLSQKVGVDQARHIFGPIVGAYDLRVGDAHPTGSGIADAMKLVGIDENLSFLRQGEQLIHNVGYAIWLTGKALYKN